ncbi:MAG TPA: tetratricopeptide repeat protein, partial [Allosphingosinicella sp.]
MAELEKPPRRPGAATVALAGAGLLALAAVGFAVTREGPGEGSSQDNMMAAAGETERQAAERLEAQLRQDPDNAAVWRNLGQTYFAIAGQAQAEEGFTTAMQRAASAYRRAAELEPQNAENWFGFGLATRELRSLPQAEQAFRRAMEAAPRNPDYAAYAAEMLLLQSGRNPPAEAETLLRRAIELDANHAQARYYLATLKDRRGDHRGAVEDLVALLRNAPAGAPWQAQVRSALEAIAGQNGIDLAGRLPAAPAQTVATAAIPGPTREQMEAARAIPPSQQDAMVKGMVDRLAARLRSEPRNADGWIMLMRSRMQLNEPQQAAEALRSGLAAFRDDAAAQQRLRTAAQELGVPAG